MGRAEKVRQKIEEIENSGGKASVNRLAKELEFSESDVHRCLNILERKGKAESFAMEAFGNRQRIASLKDN